MFDSNAWTSLVVWFALPWVQLFVIVLFVRSQEREWSSWYESLAKSMLSPPLTWFRRIGCAACMALGAFGFLVQQLGDSANAPIHVSLTFYLVHLACVAAWLVLFFESHRLWQATIAAVAALVAFTVSFMAGAFATAWSLFFSLPYCCFAAMVALACGMFAYDNPSGKHIVDPHSSAPDEIPGFT